MKNTMETQTFTLADGRTMKWNDPGSCFILTLDSSETPTCMAYYVWELDEEWLQSFKTKIEEIVGKPVRLYDTYSQGNGRGGCRIEVLN